VRVRRIARIAAIVAVLIGGSAFAGTAQAAPQSGGGRCHTTQDLGIRGTVCIGTDGGTIVARAWYSTSGPLPPVPVRVCAVIYNADIGPVGGVCRYVGAGTTVTATTRWKQGVFTADAFMLKPFWLDFGPTPAITT
jgi:hypothetical protein